MTCPSIPLGDNATVTAALAAIDCQVNQGVAAAFGRLFAAGGVFSLALTALLTIYVALLAFGFLTGRTRLTLPELAPKAVVLVLTLTFATSWQAYHVVIHGLLSAGPDQIAAALMGGSEGATLAFTSRLDALFAQVLDAAQGVSALDAEVAQNVDMAKKLIWFSGLTLLFSTLGLLVAARVVLALLLGLGPLFVVLALFSATRGLFEAWLRTTVAMAFAPMLIVLGGAGVMSLLGPLVAAIAHNPADAAETLRPIVMLSLGAGVYALLLVAAACTAISLTHGWRLGAAVPAQPALADNARASTPAERTAILSQTQDRNAELIAAVVRDRAPPLAARAAVDPLPPEPVSMRRPRPRRVGLGRTYRKTNAA
ncbi:MAG: type IV secretion system protein [Vitreimonas sp.]